MYIKCLEGEVLRLKEIYGTVCQERDNVVNENRQLRELLAAHGIVYDPSKPGPPTLMQHDSTFSGSGSGSLSPTVSSNYNAATASTGKTSPPILGHPQMTHPGAPQLAPPPMQVGAPQGQRLDYDQIGIDFVLTYDRTSYPSPPPNA
jgi:hypothetical protein